MINEPLVLNAYEHENLNFNPNVIKNGYAFYYSPAQQLASHICQKSREDFRFSKEFNGTSALIFSEKILQKENYFCAAKYSKKQCIGTLLCDINTNQIIYRKSNTDTEIQEFREDECFAVSFEIFKYLRDNDLIQICTIERKIRHRQHYTYTTTKLKAASNGTSIYCDDLGIQFLIPKPVFKCVAGKRALKNSKNKKK